MSKYVRGREKKRRPRKKKRKKKGHEGEEEHKMNYQKIFEILHDSKLRKMHRNKEVDFVFNSQQSVFE